MPRAGVRGGFPKGANRDAIGDPYSAKDVLQNHSNGFISLVCKNWLNISKTLIGYPEVSGYE